MTEQKENLKDNLKDKEKRRLSTPEIKKLPRDSAFYALGVVSRFTQRRDKNDRPYWDIAIMDGEGQIEGKIWGSSEWWDIQSDPKRKIDPMEDEKIRDLEGRTIGAQGKIVEFKDQNQCNFNAVYYVDQEKYPPHSFVRRSPVPAEGMEKELRGLIAACGEPIKGFLEFLFFERGIFRSFSAWPAAVSLHHAYVGGLLEHSLAVTRAALATARTYDGTDTDIVIAGALLHDLGKLEAYRLSPTPEMTVGGNVVDHIVMGYHRLMTLAEEYGLPQNRALPLAHILVSHHGSKEYGSPVLPATPEAMIVSVADELDFRLFCWREQTSLLDNGKEISEYIAPVQRRFWKAPRPDAPRPDVTRPDAQRPEKPVPDDAFPKLGDMLPKQV